MPSVDFYSVRHGLKGVKRQANWKHYLKKKIICVLSSEKLRKFAREEIVVLEKKQDSNVNDQA
jgi:hypothetical protein